jgi:hypothetical protein
MSEELFPFGKKFKGKPINELINPSNTEFINYLSWAQREKPGLYEQINTLIEKFKVNTINLYYSTTGNNDSPTPEHNKLQNMFLKEDVCLKLFDKFTKYGMVKTYTKELEKFSNEFKQYFTLKCGDVYHNFKDTLKLIQFEWKFNWDVCIPCNHDYKQKIEVLTKDETMKEIQKEIPIEELNKITEENQNIMKKKYDEYVKHATLEINKYKDLYEKEVYEYEENLKRHKEFKGNKSEKEFLNDLEALEFLSITEYLKDDKYKNRLSFNFGRKIYLSKLEEIRDKLDNEDKNDIHEYIDKFKNPKGVNKSYGSNFCKMEKAQKELESYISKYEDNVKLELQKKIDNFYKDQYNTNIDKLKKYENLKFNIFDYNKENLSILGNYNIHLDINENIFIEIKTSLGDDYPCVLRKMRNQKDQTLNHFKTGSYYSSLYFRFILLIKSFNSTNTTRDELIKIFNQADIHVIFTNELFGEENPLSILDQKEELIKKLIEENDILKEKLLKYES